MNNLQIRLIAFSVLVLKLIRNFRNDPLLAPILSQLVRSATSIGANYSESQASGYAKDFHLKIRIALKEAKETEYWLEILSQTVKSQKLSQAKIEVLELIKILTVISKKTTPESLKKKQQ